MNKTVALTGTTGAMGGEVLLSLLQSPLNLNVRCIIFEKEKRIPRFVKNTLKNTAAEYTLLKAIFPDLTTAKSL